MEEIPGEILVSDAECLEPDIQSGIKMLVSDIYQYPLLSHEKTLELFAQLKEDPPREDIKEIKDKIINANLRIIFFLAKRIKSYKNTGDLSLQDLFGYGVFGLIKAVEKFDPKLGYHFSTYATYWIKQAILRAVNNYSTTIRKPVHMVNYIAMFFRATEELAIELNRQPELEEIAKKMGISLQSAKFIRQAILTNRTRSLEKRVNPNSDLLLGGTIEDKEENHEKEGESNLLKEGLARILDEHLDSRQRRIIILRFGFDGNPSKTLEEIAKEFGLTRERIRQIEKKALKALKKYIQINPLSASQ